MMVPPRRDPVHEVHAGTPQRDAVVALKARKKTTFPSFTVARYPTTKTRQGPRHALRAGRLRVPSRHDLARVPHDHRAVPYPLGRATPDHLPRGARGRDPRRRLQPFQPARRRRPDRPAHRFRDGRDVARSVGRDPARRRELRWLAVVLRVPRRGARPVPVRARHPDPSGAGGREDPLHRARGTGQGGPQQHALRHDARERRVHRRRGGRPRDPRGPRARERASL